MNSMKCYKTLFTKDGIATNYGNYILLFLNTIFYILGICFYKFGYPSLNDKITALKETKIEGGINNINKNETNGEKELNNPKKKKKGKKTKNNKNPNENKIIKFDKKISTKKAKKKNKIYTLSKSNKNKSLSKIELKVNDSN